MKTLSEHNAERESVVEWLKHKQKAGVACNKCGQEMLLEQANSYNTTNPPTQWVRCPGCGERGLKTC